MKSKVFRRFLKQAVTDHADVTLFVGSVFHCRKAATGKARWPIVERRVRRATSVVDEAARRRRRASTADDWRNVTVSSHELQRVGKGTAEKKGLPMTARKLAATAQTRNYVANFIRVISFLDCKTKRFMDDARQKF